MKLRFFGRFNAQKTSGETIDVPGKKVQALLAYLAVECTRPHSREKLATMLWGDTGEERSRHNLRQALSKIRQYGGWVRSEGECLELDLSECEADVVLFRELCTSQDAYALRRCLDLYQGELLHEINLREPDYDDWLMLTRQQLRQTACQVALRLCEKHCEANRLDDAICAINDLLTIDRAHEPAHRELMSLLDQAGRRSDALRQYQICTEALQRDLGISPSEETRQLEQRIRHATHTTINEQSADSIASGPNPPSVAVLPFENRSSSEDAYFVDGITEDLITALSCFHSLVVIARVSSFAYRDRNLNEQAIANQLGAQYLVCGSVQRSGKRVRINVQLLDAQAGMHVWGHRFEREIQDIFVLQDEITSTVVSTLAGRVEAARLARARQAPPERLDAYDLLLRGKDYHHRFNPEGCKLCINMFQKSIERDPSYAVAHAWLACGYGQAMYFRLDDTSTLIDKSQAAAEKCLELDENESECHRILAQINLTRGSLERAIWHQERGLFLNPNDDRIVCAMGEILAFIGKAEEAETWVRKAMRLNPYHPPRYWTHLARALFHRERYREAFTALDNVGKARTDDLVYRTAAAAQLRDDNLLKRAITELRENERDFDPKAFVRSLPYQRDEDRQLLLNSLCVVEN